MLLILPGEQHLGQKGSDVQLKLEIGQHVLISLCASYILALVEIVTDCDAHLHLKNLGN